MSKSAEERTFMIDSDPWAFLPPKQRDEYYIQNYGMTFAEWQKANPPPTDEEWDEYWKDVKFKE